MPREGRFYLAGAALGFLGLSILVLGGSGWLGGLLLAAGLATLLRGGWLAYQRLGRIRIELVDEQLHPVPVLGAPKGTWDLVVGVGVRVRGARAEPLGLRIEAILYHRDARRWDRRVGDGAPVELLKPSLAPGRGGRTLVAKGALRLPAELTELTPDHFVKLLIRTTDFGTIVRRLFVAESFALRPAAAPGEGGTAREGAPLLPFDRAAQAAGRRRGDAARRLRTRLGDLPAHAGDLVRRLRGEEESKVVRLHQMRNSKDSLEGLAEELEKELDEEEG